MLVFFITCFLPFVRPSIAQLKDTDIKKARKTTKSLIGEVESIASCNLELDFLSQCKETMRQLYSNKKALKFNGKSMYLKLYLDKKQKNDENEQVFNQSLYCGE